MKYQVIEKVLGFDHRHIVMRPNKNFYVKEYKGNKNTLIRSLDTKDLFVARQKALIVDMQPRPVPKKYSKIDTTYKFQDNTSERTGVIAELIFEDHMLHKNYEVYKPIVDRTGVDYIVEKDGKMYKFQVKSTNKPYESKRSIKITTRGKKHYSSLCDYIAYLDLDDNAMYILPTKDLPLDKQSIPFSRIRDYCTTF